MAEEEFNSKAIGRQIVLLIQSLSPARLTNPKPTARNINESLLSYIQHNITKGEQGEPFKSDHWQLDDNSGWFIAIPEIIRHNNTIYFQCRWWSRRGGFYCSVEATPVILADHSPGWRILKKGHNPQSFIQFFIGNDGEVQEYIRIDIAQPLQEPETNSIPCFGNSTTPLRHNDSLTELLTFICNSISFHPQSFRLVMEEFFTF